MTSAAVAGSDVAGAGADRGPGLLRLGLEHLGRAALLAVAVTVALRTPRKWLAASLEEIHRQAIIALPLAVFLAALGGVVTSQQTGYQFQANLPHWVIGNVVAATVITEMAPLLTAFALVGIVGARIAAELGAMQVTEQIDALEVIGRDPVTYLVVPRVLAGLVVGPLLVAFALPASLFAGWAAAMLTTPVTSAEFWFGVRYYIRDFPFFFALIKGVAFGVGITFLGSYVGLEARGGSMGVGRATTWAVVAMISAIVVLDTLLVPLLKLIRV